MAAAHGRGSIDTADRASARARFPTATTVVCARRAPGSDDVFTREDFPMAMTAAELIKADQDHLIHPLHHPIDNAEPVIYVRGRGAMIEDIGGHQMIDGLSGLWEVHVGHGRNELARAGHAHN